MKIKRFEASSMSEALRNIKKEFGEEAVILSAKTVKKSSLLGKKKNSQVVVTAAIDKTAHHVGAQDVEAVLSATTTENENSKTISEEQNYSRINILKKFNPITPTGQKKVKPKLVQLMSATAENANDRYAYDLLVKQGVSEKNAAEMERKIGSLLPAEGVTENDYRTALAQVLEADRVVGHGGNNFQLNQRIMVMLGPSGVGKTSAVAKLCARHILQYHKTVALVSLDNQRVAGTSELERYARILDVPLKSVDDVDALENTLSQLASFDLVIVDTPGMAADDHILCEKTRRIIAALEDPDLYLLLGADIQEKAMAKIISFYKPFGIRRLFFTRLDWATDMGAMINQAIASNLPITYLSDSPKVPDGIHVANGQDLADRIVPGKKNITMTDEQGAMTIIKQSNASLSDNYYLANRNSDIFHLSDCKSVKRINTDNMIVFKDPAEAMGQNFKPCRMCCSELIFHKQIDRPVRGYAGNRY